MLLSALNNITREHHHATTRMCVRSRVHTGGISHCKQNCACAFRQIIIKLTNHRPGWWHNSNYVLSSKVITMVWRIWRYVISVAVIQSVKPSQNNHVWNSSSVLYICVAFVVVMFILCFILYCHAKYTCITTYLHYASMCTITLHVIQGLAQKPRTTDRVSVWSIETITHKCMYRLNLEMLHA